MLEAAGLFQKVKAALRPLFLALLVVWPQTPSLFHASSHPGGKGVWLPLEEAPQGLLGWCSGSAVLITSTSLSRSWGGYCRTKASICSAAILQNAPCALRSWALCWIVLWCPSSPWEVSLWSPRDFTLDVADVWACMKASHEIRT